MTKKSKKILTDANNKTLRNADYERIGKMFVSVIESSYARRWRLYTFSIVKGFFTGLGGVIGATLGVAILLYVLSFLDSIPIIDNFIDIIRRSDNSNI